MNFEAKTVNASFYNKPEMVGHILAKKSLDELESLLEKVMKTKNQKLLVSLLVDFDCLDWHYWYTTWTKAEIQRLSYVIRRVDKKGPLYLLQWYQSKSRVLKTKFDHVLEYMSFLKNKSEYFIVYKRTFAFYGMKEVDIQKRFEEYHRGLERYEYIKRLRDEL